MNDSLEALQGEVLDRIQQANSEKELEQMRVEVLGRSGSVTLLLRGLKDLPGEERPAGRRAAQPAAPHSRRAFGGAARRRKAASQNPGAQRRDESTSRFPGTRLERGAVLIRSRW